MTDTMLPAASSVTGGPALPQERRVVTAIPGPKSQELLARRSEAVSAALGAALPVFVEAAGGGVIVDVDGNSFIDLASGIAVTSVGVSAPAVVANVQAQVEKFTHTCFMIVPYLGYVEVCEALNRIVPGDFAKKSALFNSGAEAVENAIKVARSATGRTAVVAFEHAYHGRTNLTMALTAKNMPYKQGFGPFASDVYRVPTSYPFRDGPHDGAEVASWAISKIDKEVGSANVAAIIIEPIMGEGGFIVPAPGFLKAIADYAKANGIVFIADEIQTGFGRTGKWFAIEHEDVEADIVVTAKGIAGGLPLSAITGRADLMDSVHRGGMGGTYGGNPIACAAALGVIQEFEENNLMAKATAIETLMKPRLAQIAERTGVIGDVRGRGAMIAIEVVRPDTSEPDADLVTAVIAECTAAGVLVISAGTYGNVLRFLPPLSMPEHLLIEALDVIEQAFVSALAARS
jgi:4-aminobutyrate aminotransferase / (S)-3-amino-2-methylpropionate transaminase / 5-aminovalerate transaminase